jgi:translation initiation factor 2B subunit (eIF-2B alpha/beta/delta family)/8-oxo-dGTP pyrophosphatase MutT (NUDIX family)
MQLRHVVTCFLRHPEQRTVLLGRRSDEVHTYPLHYAAVSGSIENESPRERALIEIREETGLSPEQVRLTSEGWPIRFPAWELDTVWVVHPFLFECEDPASVQRNWEHLEFEWVPPENIGALQTVPNLREAWESARDAAAAGGYARSDRIFETIRSDREHGASELGIWALRGIRTAVQEVAETEGSSPLDALKGTCRRALGLRPSMATTLTAGLEAWEALRGIDFTAGSWEQEADEALKKSLDARDDAALRAAERAARCLPENARVITISSSFTVLATLREAADRIGALTVAESRPACEGRRTAATAASFGIDTELLTDAAACDAVRQSDVVLVGADSLLANGSVVNKVGTLGLCAASRLFNVQSLAVVTTDKLLPRGHHPKMEEMEPEELGDPLEGVTLRNPYFERVPGEALDDIITDSGHAELPALRERADRLRGLMEDLGA